MMEAARQFFLLARKPGHMFAILVSLAGASLFAVSNALSLNSYSLPDWIMVYTLIAGVLILEKYTFRLPPEGNQQSMDSSIYLAAVFVYGSPFSLFILFVSSVMLSIYDRSMVWWKRPLNFAIYTFMISGAHLTFLLLGGKYGTFDLHQFYAYLASLAVYFSINVLFVGSYFYLIYKGTFYDFIRSILKDTLFAYTSTLLLSLVLMILIVSNHSLGLFLFLAIAVLLSHVFQQLFLMYSKISERANIDQRTSLFSHSYFEEKLDNYMQQARDDDTPLTLALLDLDDFKKYNDAFGHPQGDRLLGFFGQIVKTESEAQEWFAARYGGEEFSIIMPGFTKERAKASINALRKKINDTPFEGTEVFPHGCISFSAGLLEVSTETYNKSQLIDMADRALYVAKAKGKNNVFIYGEESNLPQNLEQELNELEQQLKIFLSKDVYTFKHSKRVFSYAVDMAEQLKLNDNDRRLLILGSLIHDIGKLEIPRDILNKVSPLTQEEWIIVKKHVLWGKQIVLATDKFKDLAPLVELHHERYDGKGYPNGLKENQIPRLARMLCIIDSFDAMTTERPYQKTKSFEEALKELEACSGSQFDPELVVHFIDYMKSKTNDGHVFQPSDTEAV
jgi:diguanylate cyclase (GGDEF)-like protein